MALYKDIEEYGIIGNLETCALVGIDGSIDWLCLPHLESSSTFASLLDAQKGGRFAIAPTSPYSSRQAYVSCTNILETCFETEHGKATITDFMTVKAERFPRDHRILARRVTGVEGEISLRLSFQPRPDYARRVPELFVGGTWARCSQECGDLFLHSDIPLAMAAGGAVCTFSVGPGDEKWFLLRYGEGAGNPLGLEQCRKMYEEVSGFWREWLHRGKVSDCVATDEWQDLMMRSDLVLKLLVNPDTGAIAAAATTSLPEEIGGVRNWDYRFAWLRDSAFTIQALFHRGHEEELQNFCGWLAEVVEKTQAMDELKPLYGIHSMDAVAEHELIHLSGYKGSRPVRIGNDAARQTQLDVYGELINAIYETTRHGDRFSEQGWSMIRNIIDYVCSAWRKKDSGIWEMRDEPRHYVHSKLMCWVAVDRGIRLAEMTGGDHLRGMWEKTRNELRQEIMNYGFSTRQNSFVQSFGSEALDATALLIGYLEFLPADHPMVMGSIDAVMAKLMTEEGLVYRYTSEDGLSGKEGVFFLCSFWLVTALALAGRVAEAETLFRKVLKYKSPLGLFAEEVDPVTGKQLGNYPQAFSHIGIINSALYLGIAKGKGYRGPAPPGLHG